MAKMIQIRNVPDEIHRAMKAKAALAGKSLSELILDELRVMASLPTTEELRSHLRDAQPFEMSNSSASLIRKDRDAA